MIRRIILALVLAACIAPALAQAPPPVPALADAERRTSYSITGTTCACSVGFDLYGDGTDYQNWVEVFLNGVRVSYNDATFGWTITSPSGSLGSIARPVSNAVLTFNSVQTGTVQIVGARKPRRTSQFNENAGVPARNLNQVLTDIISQNREIWDKTNDVTGRALLGLPGENISPLQPAAIRAGKFFIWDGSGNPSSTSPTLGTGNVLGPASSTVNHLACWNNTGGTLLKDCTDIGAATGTSLALSSELDASHVFIGSGASPASTHAILITKNFAAGNDVAGIQNSFTATGTSADVAGMFVAPSIANGGVVADMYGVRVETVNMIGTATLNIYKAFRVDDLTSLTVGSSKWAFHAEGANAGGASKFGNTTINADTGLAFTVGNGIAGGNPTITINGGSSGNGSGGLFAGQVGGVNSFFFGHHSAMFGGTFTTDTTIATASGKKLELSPGLVGGAFSQTVTTTLNPSGGVGIGTATDPGVGALLATDLYSNNTNFLIRTKTALSNAAAANTATLTNAPVAGNPTKWISFDDNGTTRRIPAW